MPVQTLAGFDVRERTGGSRDGVSVWGRGGGVKRGNRKRYRQE